MHGARSPKSHAFHSSDPFLVLCFRSLLFCFNCTLLHTHFQVAPDDQWNCRAQAKSWAPLRAHGHARPRRHHTSQPSWSCGTCGRGPFARARALACVHCMTCAPMAEDELRRLKVPPRSPHRLSTPKFQIYLLQKHASSATPHVFCRRGPPALVADPPFLCHTGPLLEKLVFCLTGP